MFFPYRSSPNRTHTIVLSLCWLFLTLAIVVLIVSIATEKIDRYHFYNSDALSIPAMYEDLVDGYSLRGWFFGPAPSFFPDLPLYLLARFLMRDLHLAIIVYGLGQFLLFIFSFIILSRQIFGPRNPLHAPVLVAGIALCLMLSTGECTALLPVLLNSFHFGATLMLVISLAVVIPLVRNDKNKGVRTLVLSGLLWLLSTLTLASDAIYLVQFLLPVLGVLFVLFILSFISVRSVLSIYIPIIFSILAVPKIHEWLLIYRNVRKNSSPARLILETLLTNSSQTFSEIAGWKDGFWFSPTVFTIIQIIWIAFVAGSLVCIVFAFKTALPYRRKHLSTSGFIVTAIVFGLSIGTIIVSSAGRISPWIVWIGFIPTVLALGRFALKDTLHTEDRSTPNIGILVTCMVFVFSLTTNIVSALFVGVGLPRYFLPAILIPVFFGWPFLIAGWEKSRTALGKPWARYSLLGITLVIFLVSGAFQNIRNVSALTRVRDYYPEFAQCLDRETGLRNLHNGLTQYWDAKYLTMLSKNNLRLVQVRHSLRKGIVIEHFVNNLNWYNIDFDFIITEDQLSGMRALQSAKVIQQFGEPADRFVCHDRNGAERTILVYNRPEDRLFQQQYRKHFFQYFHAAELPGQVGDIVGSSRIVHEGPSGFLTYGPYRELFLGDYAFAIQSDVHSQGGNEVGNWDVIFHPADSDQMRTLIKGAFLEDGKQILSDIFKIREPGKIEIRTHYAGYGTLRVDNLHIKRIR